MEWSAAFTDSEVGYKLLKRRRAMELFTLGIDLGKTTFHLVGMNQRGEVVVRKRFSGAALALHRELEDGANRHGSLRRITFSWASVAGARA